MNMGKDISFITELKPNEVFVFGSNTAGRHGKGAARRARLMFGAENGVGEGMTGQCYAFPTLDGRLQRLSHGRLVIGRLRLYDTCLRNPGLTFLLTKVGCGLAGFSEDFMKSLFHNPPKNLKLPKDWDPYGGTVWVQCEECGHEQSDMGNSVRCEECGWGPMPTGDKPMKQHG